MCVSRRKVSPCSPETYVCAKIGTVSCSFSQTAREELDIPITKSTFWSDSTCELQYIRNQSKRFHTFVANRLSVIHDNSAPCQWRHVSSELNPADEISRGLTVDEMRTNSKWLNGPQFLRKKKECWPRDPTVHQPELSDDDPQIKRDSQSCSQSLTHHHQFDGALLVLEKIKEGCGLAIEIRDVVRRGIQPEFS